MSWSRRSKAAVLVTAAVLGAGLAAALFIATPTGQPGRPVFDSAKWKKDKGIGTGIRLGMADTLLQQQTLLFLTRTQVIEMLGEPDSAAPDHLSYLLGPERGPSSIDDVYLRLELDRNGRVYDEGLHYT